VWSRSTQRHRQRAAGPSHDLEDRVVDDAARFRPRCHRGVTVDGMDLGQLSRHLTSPLLVGGATGDRPSQAVGLERCPQDGALGQPQLLLGGRERVPVADDAVEVDHQGADHRAMLPHAPRRRDGSPSVADGRRDKWCVEAGRWRD
jgi:hypothetical protein